MHGLALCHQVSGKTTKKCPHLALQKQNVIIRHQAF